MDNPETQTILDTTHRKKKKKTTTQNTKKWTEGYDR